MVAEPQNVIPFGSQIMIPARVMLDALRLVVLPTIDLNDQMRSIADKIDDVGTDRLLPAETRTAQPMSTQRIPHCALGIGQIAT
jgi:hypothetical protein